MTTEHVQRTCAILGSIIFFTTFSVHAVDKQVIAGAGPSTEIAREFAKELEAALPKGQVEFIVPEISTKHAGGIKNSDTFIFGRTGRPLKDEEKAMNKVEIPLGALKATFAVGAKAGVASLSLQQVQDIYYKKIKIWKEVGGADAPIQTLGREPEEAIFSLIKQKYPFMSTATFDLVLTTDDQVQNALNNKFGEYGIGFGAASTLKNRQRIGVSGFSASVVVGLVYDKKNQDHAYVKAAQKIAASPQWKKKITELGYEVAP